MEGLRRAPDGIPASVNPHLFPVGCVGYPRGADADTEIALAERWLREQGCTVARGPLEGATWYPYRANLGPHDRPPFPGEPTAGPAPWLRRGYTVTARYTSTIEDSDEVVARRRHRLDRFQREGWTVRTLAEVGDFDLVVGLYHAIASRAFQDAWSFSPIDLPAFRALYEPFRGRVEAGLVLLGFGPDGQPVGFSLGLPCPWDPRRPAFVQKSLAALPELAGQGVGSWLTGEVHRRALALGYQGGGIHALMWTESGSQRVSTDSRVFRRYALYDKPLVPPREGA